MSGKGREGSKGWQRAYIDVLSYHIGFSMVLKVSIVPPEAGHTLHQSYHHMVKCTVEIGDLEHSMVTKVVL